MSQLDSGQGKASLKANEKVIQQQPLTPVVEEYCWTIGPALSRRERGKGELIPRGFRSISLDSLKLVRMPRWRGNRAA